MTVNIQLIEKRSLGPARWANLFMGAAGITAALASNANALMLDGLFSGVNFVAAVVAARARTTKPGLSVGRDTCTNPTSRGRRPRRPPGHW